MGGKWPDMFTKKFQYLSCIATLNMASVTSYDVYPSNALPTTVYQPKYTKSNELKIIGKWLALKNYDQFCDKYWWVPDRVLPGLIILPFSYRYSKILKK